MNYHRCSLYAALLVILVGGGWPTSAFGQHRAASSAPMPSQRFAEHPAQQVLDVNQMTTWVRRDGFFGWLDPKVLLNGTYPKDVPAGVVFAQGVVWGGHVRDGRDTTLRVGGNSYRSGLQPGKVLFNADGSVAGADDPEDRATYHVWRVHRDEGSLNYWAAATRFFGIESWEVTEAQVEALRAQYAYDWQHWPADLGAPYEDVDGDGTYDPEVDVPGEPGADQTLWLVANDLDPDLTHELSGSPPIGIEHQVTLWGYDDVTGVAHRAVDNIHFQRSRLIYTGTAVTPEQAVIDSMFVAFWAESDLGDFADDFCGFDTTRGLGYVFNASSHDAVYDTLNFGSPNVGPPAVGWDMVERPKRANGASVPLSTFFCDRAGTDIISPHIGSYEGTLQWFNFMRGVRPYPAYPSAEPFINPETNEPTSFVLTGDPIKRTGWVDGVEVPPGNRSLHMAAGPFTMQRGDTVDVVISQIAAMSESHLASLSLLYYYDDVSQYLYGDGALRSDLQDPPEVSEHPVVGPVYPNPSRGSVQLVLNLERSGRYRIVLYDLLGRRVETRRLVVSSPGPGQTAINFTNRPAGTYLLVVEDEHGVPIGHRPVTFVP